MNFKTIVVKTILLSTALTSLSGCGNISDIVDDGLSFVNSIIENPGETWNDIVNFGEDIWNDALTIGEDALSDISTWGQAAWTDVVDWSRVQGEAAVEWTTKTINGVTVFLAEVGDYIISVKNGAVAFGLKKGIEKLDLFKPTIEEDGWEEYVGDPETLVYSLIQNQLAKAYEVFPGKVILPVSGDEVYGIAFTDKKSAFILNPNTVNQKHYFSTGFISLVDEFYVTSDDYEAGLEIVRVDNTDSSRNGYFYAYNLQPFDTHIVIDNQYIQYGIDSNYQVYYESNDVLGNYNQALGGLYSYDEDRFVFGSDNGIVPIKENAISENFNFETWSAAINENLKNGFSLDFDFLKYTVSNALDTVKNIFNNLNEQTILGYSLADLKNLLGDIKEDDIAIIDDTKVAMHAVSSTIPSDIIKWIVAATTVISLIGTIVVSLSFPTLAPFASAITGGAMQTFVETVIENHQVSEIDWIKVGIASIAGAISSQLGPIGDAFVGGITNSLFSLLEGETFLDTALSFVSGFAIGLAMSGIFTVLLRAFNVVGAKLSNVFTNKVGSYIARNMANIDGSLATKAFVNTTDSVNINSRVSNSVNDVVQSIDNNLSYLTKKAIKQLPSDKNPFLVKVDSLGKPIKKIDLFKNGGNGYLTLRDIPDNKFRSLFVDKFGNPIDRLPIKNGYVLFEDVGLVKIKLESGDFLSIKRHQNFAQFDRQLRELIINNDPAIPTKVYNYFIEKGIDFENITLEQIRRMRSGAGLNLSWHEAEDTASGILVSGTLHSFISHAGGISLVKFSVANGIPIELLLSGAFS
jgi:hypothetical protein